jgi:hypothetical protein
MAFVYRITFLVHFTMLAPSTQMCIVALKQPQIRSSICSQQPQIKSSWTEVTFNTLKDAQMHSMNSNHHPKATIYAFKQCKHLNQHLQLPNVHLYTSNAIIFEPPSLQAPTDGPNVLQCISYSKCPKGSSKHWNRLRSTP